MTLSRQVQTGCLVDLAKPAFAGTLDERTTPLAYIPRAKMSSNLLLKTSAIEALACLTKVFMYTPIVV